MACKASAPGSLEMDGESLNDEVLLARKASVTRGSSRRVVGWFLNPEVLPFLKARLPELCYNRESGKLLSIL